MSSSSLSTIRLGVVGVGRGQAFMQQAPAGSVILCRMDNGAVFRIWGLSMSSIERIRYEVHGGGDFWTSYDFANAIWEGKPPYLDVHRATAMSVVSILGWRSCLEEDQPYDIPDFRDPAARNAVRQDHWSPFPEEAGPGQPPPGARGYVAPSPEAIARAEAVWSKES